MTYNLLCLNELKHIQELSNQQLKKINVVLIICLMQQWCEQHKNVFVEDVLKAVWLMHFASVSTCDHLHIYASNKILLSHKIIRNLLFALYLL